MPPALILGGRGKRIIAICREGKVAAAERIDQVWALEGRGWLLGRLVVQERTARQQTDGLRDRGLEQTAELRMRAAMRGQSLAKCEESR
jgi:hypothetical protein